MGTRFSEHREYFHIYWGQESQFVKQPASHLGWLSCTPGIGEKSLMAPEQAETQTLLSTTARYHQGAASQRQDVHLQQLFCPIFSELAQRTALLLAFFLRSFLYISIFFLFKHQEAPESFVWLFFYFVYFCGWGDIETGSKVTSNFYSVSSSALPPEG